LGKQILAFIDQSVKKNTLFSALFFCGSKQRPTVTMVIYFAYTELIGSLTCGTEYDTNQGNFVST
jgi:hypothetical protein